MKKLVIFLDPAHGENTPGKRSPDGKYREYRWSRDILTELYRRLECTGFFEVHFTTTSINEPGLSVRKDYVSNFKVLPGQTKFLFSLHTNAKGDGETWYNDARGVEIWTTKGYTKSDIFAEIIIDNLMEDFNIIKGFPNFRINKWSPGEKDKEENFTVLTGSGYYATLLEFLFHTSKEDLKLLLDRNIQEILINSLVRSFFLINTSLK